MSTVKNNVWSTVEASVANQSHGLTGNESSWERITKVPGPMFQGEKTPGNESSRKRIGQGPIGTFTPGSELARKQKGSVPNDYTHGYGRS